MLIHVQVKNRSLGLSCLSIIIVLSMSDSDLFEDQSLVIVYGCVMWDKPHSTCIGLFQVFVKVESLQWLSIDSPHLEMALTAKNSYLLAFEIFLLEIFKIQRALGAWIWWAFIAEIEGYIDTVESLLTPALNVFKAWFVLWRYHGLLTMTLWLFDMMESKSGCWYQWSKHSPFTLQTLLNTVLFLDSCSFECHLCCFGSWSRSFPCLKCHSSQGMPGLFAMSPKRVESFLGSYKR